MRRRALARLAASLTTAGFLTAAGSAGAAGAAPAPAPAPAAGAGGGGGGAALAREVRLGLAARTAGVGAAGATGALALLSADASAAAIFDDKSAIIVVLCCFCWFSLISHQSGALLLVLWLCVCRVSVHKQCKRELQTCYTGVWVWLTFESFAGTRARAG